MDIYLFILVSTVMLRVVEKVSDLVILVYKLNSFLSNFKDSHSNVLTAGFHELCQPKTPIRNEVWNLAT